MLERFYQFIGALIWRTILTLLVMLAIVVSAAGVLTPMLPSANSAVAEFIGDRTGLRILIGALDGEMRGFRPRIKLQDVQIIGQLTDDDSAVFGASSVELTVNLWRSLIQWQLVAAELSASNIDMPAAIDAVDRSIVIPFDPNVFATDIERIELDAMRVTLTRLSAPTQRPLILDVHLGLQRLGSERRLQVVATDIAQNRLIVSGEGVGNPLQFGRFDGEFTGQLQARDLSPVTQFLGADLLGEGVANLWIDAARDGLTATISAELRNVALRESEGEIDQMSLVGVGAYDGVSSTFKLAQLDASEEGNEISINPLAFTVDPGSIMFRGGALNLPDLVRIGRALQPADSEIISRLSQLTPVGVISDISVEVPRQGPYWRAAFSYDGLGWLALNAIPGAKNLAGQAIVSNSGGSQYEAKVTLDSRALALSLPRQYRAPIELNALSGEFGLQWTAGALQLVDGRVIADADAYSARALVSANVPLNRDDGAYPQLFLSMASDQVPVENARELVPIGIDRDVYQWLQQSVSGGSARNASFVWRGSLIPKDIRRRSVQLGAEFDIEQLEILPTLPTAKDIDGRLVLDNALVTVIGDQAQLATTDISDALVQVGRVDGKSVLVSNANLSSDADQAFQQLSGFSFVDPDFKSVMDRLTVSGDLVGKIEVRHPIKERETPPAVCLAVDIQDVDLIDNPSGVHGSDWNGSLSYLQGTGITGGRLDGQLLNAPAAIVFKSPKADSRLELELDTRAQLSEWSKKLDLPVINGLSGETDLRVAVSVNEGIELNANSSLVGVDVPLPVPLGKRPSEELPINFSLRRFEDLQFEIQWLDRMHAEYKASPDGDWWAAVYLGDRTSLDDKVQTQQRFGHGSNRVVISGGYSNIDLEPWISLLSDRLASPAGAGVIDMTVSNLNLQGTRLRDRNIGDFQLNAVLADSDYSIGIESEWISGEIAGTGDGEPLQISVSQLDLDFLRSEIEAQEQPSTFNVNSLQGLPDISLNIDNIRWRDGDLGGISLTARSEPSALVLSSVTGGLAGLNIDETTELRWSAENDQGDTTQLKFVASLEEPDLLLPLLSQEPVVGLTGGRADMSINWRGSPLQYDLRSVTGSANLRLTEGTFLPVSSDATGALRFISLFNLAGLVQRSNVNQLFDSGLTFDRALGDIALDQGVVDVKSFNVRNSGGSLNLVGSLDLNAETVDAELSVTLPLVENIPWVAALAGGLPVAAGAYLASRIFEDQVNRLSSGVYEVTGDIAQPSVRFVRVFDANKSGGSQESAASASDRK